MNMNKKCFPVMLKTTSLRLSSMQKYIWSRGIP